MRTPTINAILEATISRPRLEKYLTATGGNLDQALTLYERNARLSDAFYGPLQCLEICLRNTLNTKLETGYGTDWFQNGRPPFHQYTIDALREAESAITTARKPITNGAVVAELSFYFWVALLGPSYDATVWRRCLFAAFREHDRIMQRKRVHGRVNAIRRFRNRIAHHEPIFLNNLQNTHSEIIETISWMCPTTAAWARYHSRFDAVFAAA